MSEITVSPLTNCIKLYILEGVVGWILGTISQIKGLLLEALDKTLENQPQGEM